MSDFLNIKMCGTETCERYCISIRRIAFPIETNKPRHTYHYGQVCRGPKSLSVNLADLALASFSYLSIERGLVSEGLFSLQVDGFKEEIVEQVFIEFKIRIQCLVQQIDVLFSLKFHDYVVGVFSG